MTSANLVHMYRLYHQTTGVPYRAHDGYIWTFMFRSRAEKFQAAMKLEDFEVDEIR